MSSSNNNGGIWRKLNQNEGPIPRHHALYLYIAIPVPIHPLYWIFTLNILHFYFIFPVLLRKYIKMKVSSWYFKITFMGHTKWDISIYVDNSVTNSSFHDHDERNNIKKILALAKEIFVTYSLRYSILSLHWLSTGTVRGYIDSRSTQGVGVSG